MSRISAFLTVLWEHGGIVEDMTHQLARRKHNRNRNHAVTGRHRPQASCCVVASSTEALGAVLVDQPARPGAVVGVKSAR